MIKHGLTGDEKKGRELLIQDSCECKLELKVWEMRVLAVSLTQLHAFAASMIYVQMCTDKVLWDIMQTQMEQNVTKVAITVEMCCFPKSLVTIACCCMLWMYDW